MARERCKVCHNALSACICKWVSPIFNKTTVVVLQHTDEAKKPLGTAKIVSLCLQNSIVKVGVDFSNDADFSRLADSDSENTAILYPSDSAIKLESWCSNTLSSPNTLSPDRLPKTLIVLDGTWRNTREIINVNPVLKKIRAVKLAPNGKSNYRIRKAPFEHSLSTVEAVSQALTALEPETSTDVMLECFQKMIDYQISRMGEAVYRKNYLAT